MLLSLDEKVAVPSLIIFIEDNTFVVVVAVEVVVGLSTSESFSTTTSTGDDEEGEERQMEPNKVARGDKKVGNNSFDDVDGDTIIIDST